MISIHAPRVGSDAERAVGPGGGRAYFNPRSPCGERPRRASGVGMILPFQSTLPVWGATKASNAQELVLEFQSTLPVWGATPIYGLICTSYVSIFQSTLPVWGATSAAGLGNMLHGISIHAPRVGSDPAIPWRSKGSGLISIHAPRVGSDGRRHPPAGAGAISIHAPRVGSDQLVHGVFSLCSNFNPRSPCGERRRCGCLLSLLCDFNPRSPCGERPHAQGPGPDGGGISIHAPRVGSDPGKSRRVLKIGKFQSTLPVWGATPSDREETKPLHLFQSTLPVWGATTATGAPTPPSEFQSTLPVWGATPAGGPYAGCRCNFNPRSPCGERQVDQLERDLVAIFQSTLPVWGATLAPMVSSPP